jgi:hypothetical protein
MPEDGIAAVAEAVEPVNAEVDAGESTESTGADDGHPKVKEGEQDRQDNRHQPDALKKHIAELRRRADAMTDPVEKKAELDRIKFLYDTSGKARGYEQQFPTVREAREVKALLEAVGGREGVQQMQATLSEIEQVDQALSAGDPSVVERMWEEAPDGMPKLMPALLDKFAQAKPQEYERFIAPRSIGYLDNAGFPQAFDRMVQLYDAGKTEDAQAIRNELIQWVTGNRQQAQQQQADPEVERLRAELAKRDEGQEQQKNESAINEVINYAGPAIDRVAAPIIGKFGFTKDDLSAFRRAVWNHLQDTRNEHPDYKTIGPAKIRQGRDKWVAYANRWTDDNAEASIRAVLKTPPWPRIASAKTPVAAVTKSPAQVSVQQGKQPSPSEILYGREGVDVLRKAGHWKAGYKDLADAIMDGVAPLKAGGIRRWQ